MNSCVPLLLILSGCAANAPDQPPPAIHRTFERGAVKLELEVQHDQVALVDPVQIALRLTAPESHDAAFRDLKGEIENFDVTREETLEPRLVESGSLLTEQIIELEAFLPGDYELPAIEVAYWARNDPGSPAVLETEPFNVSIESAIAADQANPELADIADPLDVPIPTWWWIAGGIALALIAAGLFYWIRERRRRAAMQPAAPPPEPHAIALSELEDLLARNLIRAGESKLFYLLLSNILRHYIERRFGLRAPERTTEEFLVELRNSSDFQPGHKAMLGDFLSLSDMVKFAEMEPSGQDADASVAACRKFILETKPQPPLLTEHAA